MDLVHRIENLPDLCSLNKEYSLNYFFLYDSLANQGF